MTDDMENLAMTDNCVPNASTSTDDKAIASRSQQNSSSKASYTKSNPASPILHSESSMTLGDTKSSGFSLDDARSQTSSVDTSTTEKEDEKPTVVAGKGPRRWRGFTVTQSTVSNGEHAGSMEDEEQEDGDDDSTSGGTMNKRRTEQEYSGVVSSSKKDEVGKQGREDLADQIQGLLVHDPASVDDEDPDSEDDRASRKSHRSTVSSLHSYVSSATNYDLLLARLGAQQHIQEQRPPVSEHQVMDTPQSQTEPSKDAANEEEETDWEFWSSVISDFDRTTRAQPTAISCHIQRAGIPPTLRGTVWQLLAKSKNCDLESQYITLLNEESVYEKAIVRDLARTFADHEYFQSKAGQEALFNIAKAYSLYDPDVGYCHGILYVAGPLLLNMPEEEAFCVLVQLMQRYGLRGHYTPQADLLSQRLYQLAWLLGDHLPHIHRHIESQGIQSSQYATNWLISLFGYKFPLDLVLRIYDALLTEGTDVLLRIILALMKKNQSNILSLEYDALLQYLKNNMLAVYKDAPTNLIRDAYQIKIPPKRLEKLAKQYQSEAARANSEVEAIEAMKRQNKALSETVRHLKSNLSDLNKEHSQMAKELIESKMEIARIHDENDALRQKSFDLKRALERLPSEVEARLKDEMEVLSTKNAALVQRNAKLEEQLAYMENMVIEMKVKFAESENERENLQQRLADLKRLVE